MTTMMMMMMAATTTTPLSTVFLDTLVVPQLVIKFPALCVTRMFITVFTRAHHSFSHWDKLIQSTHPTILSIILSSTPRFIKWPLSFRVSHQSLARISVLSLRATCSFHLVLFGLLIRIVLRTKYRSWSSSTCCFLHPSVTSSLLESLPQHPVIEY